MNCGTYLIKFHFFDINTTFSKYHVLAWITFAEDNEAVQDVLILLNSLRKVYTSNKILVILGESLTKENM